MRRRPIEALDPAGGRVLPFAAALAAALLLASCGGEEAGPADDATAVDVPEEERYGGTAVIGALSDVPTVNPLVTADYMSAQVQRWVLFAPLVRVDADLTPRPHLARSWELSADSSEIVFRLRPDVSWHDGEPVTADDVAFTFRRATDPDVAFPNRDYFDGWEEAEVVDDTTVRFTLRPTADVLFGWSQTPVVPEHVLGDVPPSELSSHPFGTSAPVGNGPFRFVERQAGDRWIFEANEDFPEALGGRPYLDRLVIRVVPDASTLAAELRRGEVHLAVQLPPRSVTGLEGIEGLRIETFPFPRYAFIGWNTRRSPFDDGRVRRALTMALDRQQILDAAREGLGSVATGPLGPWHWAYDSAWAPLPHAADSARALLEAAGWTDADGDGVRESGGEELAFDLLTTSSPQTYQDVAVMAQSDLDEVGVSVSVRTMEGAALAGTVTDPGREFDAFLLSWQPDLSVDERHFWACDRMDRPFQFSGWCDPGLDAIMDSVPMALPRETRRDLLRRYHERVAEAQPFTFMFYEDGADGVRRELRNVEPGPRGELVGVDRWWLLPGVR